MKKKRFLIVETPRGGQFGHRFIVPPENDLQPEEIELYFQKASQGQTGDFIAVQRMVEQRLPNGSVREGPETLILTGIPHSKFQQQEISAVKTKLTRKLNDLDQLVTQTINWEEVGNNTVIIRKELVDWWEKDFAADIPATRDRKKVSTSTGNSGLVMGVLMGAVLGIVALYVIFL